MNDELSKITYDQLEILKSAISRIIDIDLGIYPAAWVGKYKKRTRYMEGWNDASFQHFEKICEILRDLKIRVYDDGVIISDVEI